MEQPTKRKLAAILMADVFGYSRLMGDDEADTVRTLKAYREVFFTQIERRDGRVVNAPGDSILAEFGSVVDAVACAVEIQGDLAERNKELPHERRMHFRIGINLGDVIVEEDSIYGDGVNVAARLESLAVPAGICISGTTFDHVESKLPVEFEFVGERSVKNIAKPVRAYRVLLDKQPGAIDPAPDFEVKAAPLLPNRPSIAVLPFLNLSGDPEQDYFSDGISEDIITDLSKLRNLFVIARNSSFSYKGLNVDVRKVGREMGVRHVLEGSVRRAGGTVRITAQLVDAQTGEHLWAHRYDRELKDIFALQDEITRSIVTELEVKLVEGEQSRAWRKATTNSEAYDLVLQGESIRLRFTRHDNVRARELYRKALEIDPHFALAMAYNGFTHYVDAYSGWSESPQDSCDEALAWGNRAVALDDSLGYAYNLLGMAHLFQGDHDRGIAELRKAVDLNPSAARCYAFLGVALASVGQAEEGLENVRKAFRLNPLPLDWYHWALGVAYARLGRHDQAIAEFEEVSTRLPDYVPNQVSLTLAYMETGKVEQARTHAQNIIRLNPKVIENHIIAIADPEEKARVKSHLTNAGLP